MKRKKFIILTLLLIGSRILDGITTYIASPNLSGEINPLVAYFNFGCISLGIFQIIFTLILIYLIYYSIYTNYANKPSEKDYTFKEFTSFYLFNDKSSFLKIFYKFPKNRKATWIVLGYSFSRTLIFFGFLLAISNMLTHFVDSYAYFMSVNKGWILLYLSAVFVYLYFINNFFREEYRKYRSV